MAHFVHALGCCDSNTIGEGTRIWAFAHVLPGAALGRDCNICDHVFIENDVIIGDRVTVIPNHIGPCVNLQSTIYWQEEGDPPRPLPVDARGKVF